MAVDELDYRREAANAAAFGESIAATPLRDVVFAPRHKPREVLPPSPWLSTDAAALAMLDLLHIGCAGFVSLSQVPTPSSWCSRWLCVSCVSLR